MCTIGNDLKLCTCSKVDIESEADYWILHRDKLGELLVMGTAVQPLDFRRSTSHWPAEFQTMMADLTDQKNKIRNYVDQRILERLNKDNNYFDFEYQPEDWDKLDIYLTINHYHGIRACFTYTYFEKWRSEKRDSTSYWNTDPKRKLKGEVKMDSLSPRGPLRFTD